MARDVSKLPKWAQTRIRNLEGEVIAASRRLADVLGEAPGGTNVALYELQGMEMGERPLPRDSTVRFRIGDQTLHVEARKGFLQIYASEACLWSHNSASNVLRVRPEPY